MKTIREYVDFNILLNEFSARISKENINIPAKLSYAIYKNAGKISSTAKYFEEQRVAILNKYSEKDKDGNIVYKDNIPVIKDEKKANKEYEDLLSLDADVVLHKVDINVDNLLNELEGNHQTLTMLWAILDALNPVETLVAEELTNA
tara:strand:+ start:99 stop:539 length:441 start_codon:yes stop_codon:yes gene_type:complete